MVGVRGSWLWQALVDDALLVGAFVLAFSLRTGWPPPLANFMPFLSLMPILVIVLPLAFFGFGLYMLRRQRIASLVRGVAVADGIIFLLAVAGAFWIRGFAFPRSVLVIGFGLHGVCALAWRYVALATRKAKPQRVVVVAAQLEAVRIVAKFMREPVGWFEVVRAVEPDEVDSQGLSDLRQVDLVVLGPSVAGPDRTRLLRMAQQLRVTVFVLPDLDDILMVGSVGNQVDDLQVFEVRPLAMTTAQRASKRVIDLLVGIPMLLVAAPVMAGVWVVMKVFDPGPVMFSQTRVGLNGKEFTLYKFRTMIVNAEKKTGPVLATARDPRITPLGDILRATRLDELPQLWNVVRGDMSLVGPRPERMFFVEQFSEELPDFPLRNMVPPGVTGLAQVMGKYGTSAQDKLRFDLLYIRHYSLWLDLRILLLTVQTVVNKLGISDLGSADQDATIKAEEFVLGRSFRV